MRAAKSGDRVDGVEIRALRDGEQETWLGLRRALWPGYDPDSLRREMQEIVEDRARNAVHLAWAGGEAVGFSEASLRGWAEGCASRPVGYLEAWYVAAAWRRRGVGRSLVDAAESWARDRGCSEMGSDALLENEISHRSHRALGYAEVQRSVLYRKPLV